MSQDTNPHTNAVVKSRNEDQYSYLTFGRVTTSPDGQEGGAHHVVVQESAAPSDEPIPVIPDAHGDFYIPPEQTPVAVVPTGKNNYAVIGAPVPPVDTANIDAGERIVSHPLSKASVKFNKDGSLDIRGDTTVRINGGTAGAVTDVQGIDNSGDGNFDELSITRNPDVLL